MQSRQHRRLIVERSKMTNIKKMRSVYEVLNPSFNDMNIEQQIDAGVTDWCAEDEAGHEFFGRTRDEAEEARCLYTRVR
jgi:hypothetical protein